MKRFTYKILFLGLAALAPISSYADPNPNQTPTVSPILPEDTLPFRISIAEAPFSLPSGIHSGVSAIWKDKWLFLAGRTNGLHGFGADPFPPARQNTTAIVVDLSTLTVYTRDLDDPTSDLSREQIDTLSVTSPQFFQEKKTLYISGGYGVDTGTSNFGTKPILTAVDLPDFIKWVIDPSHSKSAAASIRQTFSSWMQVTGGAMAAVSKDLGALLIFGQNFTGVYDPSSNGAYTQQVRRFKIHDNGKELNVEKRHSENPNASYRRRDLNVVPIQKDGHPAFVALSGVFTTDGGVWTVPVEVNTDGSTFMADPTDEDTFKQGMNNYVCANVTLYSPSTKDNYIVLLGGISYETYNGSTFVPDTEIPFTNQMTTVKRDKHGNYSQYFMSSQYPQIQLGSENLLFGAGAYFIEDASVRQYPNLVVNFDKIKSPTVIGYIIGGIMSTVPNTTDSATQTAASPYIFQLIVTPVD